MLTSKCAHLSSSVALSVASFKLQLVADDESRDELEQNNTQMMITHFVYLLMQLEAERFFSHLTAFQVAIVMQARKTNSKVQCCVRLPCRHLMPTKRICLLSLSLLQVKHQQQTRSQVYRIHISIIIRLAAKERE